MSESSKCDARRPNAPRLTQNAVAGFQRILCPGSSPSGAYRELRAACARALYTPRPPRWLTCARPDNDGYLLLPGERAVLPIRHGRAIACLANPHGHGGLDHLLR